MANEKTEVTEAGAQAPVRTRVSPLQFLEQVNKERKKVTWPSMKETGWTTLMVFIMVGLTMVFFSVIDTILNYGQLLLIGAKRLF
jgi:preprotein translocase subunit SecE